MKQSGNGSDMHQGPEFWEQHIREWSQSGLGQAKYCRQERLRYHAFLYWRKRLNKSRSSQSAQQSINLVKFEIPKPVMTTPVSEHSGIQLEMNGFYINLKSDFDQGTLLRVIQVLRKPGCG